MQDVGGRWICVYWVLSVVVESSFVLVKHE
jgi:hypothetical protein